MYYSLINIFKPLRMYNEVHIANIYDIYALNTEDVCLLIIDRKIYIIM